MQTLELKNIQKSYGEKKVLQNISLQIEKGEFVVLLGESGCGKSTLLRSIAGLEEIQSGEILMDSNNIAILPPHKRGVAFVFQNYALYPHMNVYKNLSFGLKQLKVSKDEIKRKVYEISSLLNIHELLERKPSQLSGGQCQRVAMGRAMIKDPNIFLFDEPLSNLDAKLRARMRVEIKNLHKKIGATSVYVTHDQIEAMSMADRIVVLDQGQIQQVGKPTEIYDSPANRFVAEFIGSPSMNFFENFLENNSDNLSIGIRPEHISIGNPHSKDQIKFNGVIQNIELLGDFGYCQVMKESDDKKPAIIKIPRHDLSQLHLGEKIPFHFSKNQCHTFENGKHGKRRNS